MASLPLPRGWIQRHDPNYNHPFWVDTRASPPRAIWVHPYEDEQFLGEHPEVRATISRSNLDAPPSYDATMGRHAPEDGEKAGPSQHRDVVSEATEHKRGAFGRLKDKAIGTKQERETRRRMRAVEAARAEEEARQARMRQLEEREMYMQEHGGYAPYHPSHPGRAGYSSGPPVANLVLGGLVGGLLLGGLLSGGF